MSVEQFNQLGWIIIDHNIYRPLLFENNELLCFYPLSDTLNKGNMAIWNTWKDTINLR